MDRREFVRLMAAAPFVPSLKESADPPGALPKLRIVTAVRPRRRVPACPARIRGASSG